MAFVGGRGGDPLGASRDLPWVQGIRPRDETITPSTSSWMEILYFRLTGQLGRVGSSAHTRESEAVLGLTRSTYYYVGRANPRFGDITAAHDHGAKLPEAGTATSPFDTGGLVHGYVPTKNPLSQVGKRALVERWSFDGADYGELISTWIEDSFEDELDYRVGSERPRQLLVEELVLEGCSEASWVWEGRLLSDNFDEPPMPIEVIFMKPGRVALYFEWLRESKKLQPFEFQPHVLMVRALAVEVQDPVASMEDYLSRESLG